MSRVKKAVATVAASILFLIAYSDSMMLYYLMDRVEELSSPIREYEMTLILIVLTAIIIAGIWSIKSE